MILLIFSKRWGSRARADDPTLCEITRKVARSKSTTFFFFFKKKKERWILSIEKDEYKKKGSQGPGIEESFHSSFSQRSPSPISPSLLVYSFFSPLHNFSTLTPSILFPPTNACHLVCLQNVGEVIQPGLQLAHVRNQCDHDGGPCLGWQESEISEHCHVIFMQTHTYTHTYIYIYIYYLLKDPRLIEGLIPDRGAKDGNVHGVRSPP